ncbi:phage tail tape measure protein [Bifidobacterium castoris]|uniref:Phage tail protein n=1 Tax=Bifidobacterium castoris TaxID=2306972 RepID=A0A430F566_9BIFI|nr:phage tail tape measure protein [Bifidobacterium castoris]RSX46122.1 phage tail protein [Bifidobacterium castoris]
MAVNENIMVRLTANISDYSAKMQTAAAQTNQLATTIVKPTNRAKQFETAATKAGMAVGAMSLAFGVSAVRMFADFDEAMSEVQANTGATGDELESLKNAALDAGKSTVYNATESANAINELAKAGMSTADVLNGGLSGALNLAASDGMEVAAAAELMSSALAQFKLEGKDAGAVADALAAGAAAAQGSASDLGYALSQAGLVANSFGISMQETVGALSLFANTGMIGSDAGTSLKSMLQRLAGPSKEAARTMEELGINAYDASGQFIGLEALAGQLQERMGGLSMEQRNAAMNIIFGADAVRAANALYEAGASGVAQWTKTVSESGVAAKMAAAKTDNLKGDLEQLSGAFETALIKTGSGANDALRDIVQGITGVVDAFASLDEGTQQFIVKAGIMVGAVAGMHKVFGDLQNSSSAVGKNLGLALDPIQRLQTAAPLVSDGMTQVFSAMRSSARGAELMSNGMTRAQTAMSGVKSIGSGVMNLFGGPFGIALTIAGIGLANYAKKAQEAKARTQELQSAIESGANVSEQMVKQAQSVDYGWYDRWKTGVDNLSGALDKAGVSMSEFVLAAQGDTGALDKINKIIDEWSGYDSDTAEFNIARVMKSDLANLTAAYDEANQKADEAKQANEELATATGKTGDAAQDAADGTSELTAAMEESQKAAEEYADAVDDLIDSLFAMAAPALSAAQAQVQLDESIRETVENLTKQGRVLDENGNYLEGLQKEGEETKTALYGLAGQAQDTAIKFLEEGQATGDMEGATQRAGDALNNAREAFIKAATAAGISSEKANELADTYGLTRDETENLKKQLEELEKTNPNPKVNVDIQPAQSALGELASKTTSLPNGNVLIYANNQPAMLQIAEVVGAKIDPKTGQITADKAQYDAILALANGAKLNPKTGELLGDNSKYWQSVCKANGWTIDEKTGVIKGDNGHALKSVDEVNNKKVIDKYFTISDNGSAQLNINRVASLDAMQIADKTYTITERLVQMRESIDKGQAPHVFAGKATGGYVSGPGTGTSDSILNWLSNGEFVTNARSTAKYRRELEAINGGYYEQLRAASGYAAGGYVQATPAAPYVEERKAELAARTVFNQTVTNNFTANSSPYVQAELTAAKLRMNTRTLLGASR